MHPENIIFVGKYYLEWRMDFVIGTSLNNSQAIEKVNIPLYEFFFLLNIMLDKYTKFMLSNTD